MNDNYNKILSPLELYKKKDFKKKYDNLLNIKMNINDFDKIFFKEDDQNMKIIFLGSTKIKGNFIKIKKGLLKIKHQLQNILKIQ